MAQDLGALTDNQRGLCAGCASSPVADAHRRVNGTSCANDVLTGGHSGSLGLGMQACLTGAAGNGQMDSRPIKGRGLGANQQVRMSSPTYGCG
eukprot:COSAG01_NODE_3099_length_6589_cov_2.308783_1_plen_93_part_00